MTTSSIEREREGLPHWSAPVWARARAALERMSEEAKIALVRCEGRRTYQRSVEALREVRRLELVEAHLWGPTLLGRCVVELMCR